jgi:O-acetyl-ADP-ribose deacetylase
LSRIPLSSRNTLSLANERSYGIDRIAIPAISCGVYGYPISDAAAVALQACVDYCGELREITFVLFGNDVMRQFRAAVEGSEAYEVAGAEVDAAGGLQGDSKEGSAV